ncbi:MAG TPA: TonB-dependent receptor, partial [Candidatus Goldiibacteriota bacterium]|nr:TonB-dependent receptor [Candidatus Goldiibacteriota bacterium]
FMRDSTNMISWKEEVAGAGTESVTITTKTANIDRAKAMGIEVKLDVQPFDFLALSAQYNLVFLEDNMTNTGNSYVNEGNYNNKNYRFYALVKLPYSITAGVNAEYIDYRTDYRGKPVEPYFLMHLRVNQKLSKNMDLYVQVDNLLDNKDYRVVSGMPMPGRLVFAGAELVF